MTKKRVAITIVALLALAGAGGLAVAEGWRIPTIRHTGRASNSSPRRSRSAS
jgi:Flp pilus assembly protein CpaB